jgi:hypothetical protein
MKILQLTCMHTDIALVALQQSTHVLGLVSLCCCRRRRCTLQVDTEQVVSDVGEAADWDAVLALLCLLQLVGVVPPPQHFITPLLHKQIHTQG